MLLYSRLEPPDNIMTIVAHDDSKRNQEHAFSPNERERKEPESAIVRMRTYT